MLSHTLFAMLLSAAVAQSPPEQLRARALEQRFPRELPLAVPARGSPEWQSVAPGALRKSLRPPMAAEIKLDPRVGEADRGYVDRTPKTVEQMSLVLAAEPPRPEYPLLPAGPKVSGPSLAKLEVLQLPPLSRSTDAPLSLAGDPATKAMRPITAAVVKETRGPAPPRNDVAIPDPFIVQREAALPVLARDADPPATVLGTPERPQLPVAAK